VDKTVLIILLRG